MSRLEAIGSDLKNPPMMRFRIREGLTSTALRPSYFHANYHTEFHHPFDGVPACSVVRNSV